MATGVYDGPQQAPRYFIVGGEYQGLNLLCCTTLRDVILVEGCSASVMSMTCILQHAVVCWVTAVDYSHITLEAGMVMKKASGGDSPLW
jgi:hypothetical protein